MHGFGATRYDLTLAAFAAIECNFRIILLCTSPLYSRQLNLNCQMRNTVVSVLSQTGPLVIKSSQHAGKPSSQDMALLGSLAAFADNMDLQLNTLCTNEARISLKRSVYATYPAQIYLACQLQSCVITAGVAAGCGTSC